MSTSLEHAVPVHIVDTGRKTVTLLIDGRTYVVSVGDTVDIHVSLRVD